MGRIDDIRKGLADHAKKFGPTQTMIAIVSQVSSNEDSCTLVDDESDFEYPGIRLRPVLDGKEALTIVPQIGAWAIAIRIEDEEEWMLIAVSEAAKYKMVVGSMLFELSAGQFIIKNANEDMKTLMDDLFTAILNMKFTTNTGVTISLVNSASFVSLKNRFETLFKSA